MNAELASFVLFVVDAGITLFFGMFVYGVKQRRVFALGRWYIASKSMSQYFAAVSWNLFMFFVLAYFRLFEFPERLFPSLL